MLWLLPAGLFAGWCRILHRPTNPPSPAAAAPSMNVQDSLSNGYAYSNVDWDEPSRIGELPPECFIHTRAYYDNDGVVLFQHDVRGAADVTL